MVALLLTYGAVNISMVRLRSLSCLLRTVVGDISHVAFLRIEISEGVSAHTFSLFFDALFCEG